MGFAWSTLTQYTTETTAAIEQEIRDNADSVAVILETSLTWNDGIAQNVDKVSNSGRQEVRDNVDFLVTSNVCSTHNAAKYTTHLNNLHSGHNATQKSGDDSVDYTTHYNDLHTSHNATQKSVDDATDNVGHQTTHDSTYFVTHKSGYNNIEYGALNAGQEASEYGRYDTTVYTSKESVHDDGVNDVYNVSHYTAQELGIKSYN